VIFTTAHRSNKVNEQSERGHPCSEEHEVDGPVDEARGEGDEPDEGEEEGEACDDFGEDEALLGPGVCFVEGVEVFTDYAGDDLMSFVSVGGLHDGEGELRLRRQVRPRGGPWRRDG
jgi:hypothetical protein